MNQYQGDAMQLDLYWGDILPPLLMFLFFLFMLRHVRWFAVRFLEPAARRATYRICVLLFPRLIFDAPFFFERLVFYHLGRK